MRIFAGANYQFIEKRRVAYLISAAFIAVGLIAMMHGAVRGIGWVNYGIDFKGGTLLQVQFEKPLTVEYVRAALKATPVSEIARFRETSEFVIRAPLGETAEPSEGTRPIVAALESAFGSGSFTVVRTEAVGPKVGAELQRKAAVAITLSFLLTLIYLAFRFETRFGVAAILATLHDILITVGFLALFRVEIGLPTVAAILTVVGYSLNDTIVVFDRIRENFRTRHREADEAQIVNRSINETLPRTVLTSGTTVAVLLPLFLFGGIVLRDFSMVLLLGIIVGTYSSIFIASPALLEIRRWSRARERRWRRRPAKLEKQTRQEPSVREGGTRVRAAEARSKIAEFGERRNVR